MASKKAKPGTHPMFMNVEEGLYRRMVELAEKNGRTLKDEAEDAFARHLAQPPVFQVIRPPLDVREIPPPPAVQPKKRGRPPKPEETQG